MDIIPVFSSHYSLSFSRSILTLEKTSEIKENSPVSICSIAKRYNLKQIYLADSSFAGFIEAYKNFSDIEVQLCYGIKLIVCNDCEDKSDKSLMTECVVTVWMLNSNGYKDLIKIFSVAHGKTENFYYRGRIDWKQLKLLWTKNLGLSINFYNGFLARNTLEGYCCLPDLDGLNPEFEISEMNLPFDSIIKEKTVKFVGENKFKLIDIHPIHYFKKTDLKAFQVYKCILSRGTFNKPELSHFCSDRFCFEEYCNIKSITL